MARPVNADAEATRRRVLNAARDLFSERGSGGMGLREMRVTSSTDRPSTTAIAR